MWYFFLSGFISLNVPDHWYLTFKMLPSSPVGVVLLNLTPLVVEYVSFVPKEVVTLLCSHNLSHGNVPSEAGRENREKASRENAHYQWVINKKNWAIYFSMFM